MVPRLQAREAKALARSADEEARRVERTVATQEEQVTTWNRDIGVHGGHDAKASWTPCSDCDV